MRIIINSWTEESGILAYRAVVRAIKDGMQVGDLWGVGFENGASFSIRHNKASISVWPTQEPR